MMQWTSNLAVGVEEIDRQHKELFKRANDLVEAMNQGKGREKVGKTLKFLEDYVVSHFGNEERYMKRFRYPDYNSHKKQHEEFKEIFAGLKQEYESKGGSSAMAIEIQKKVGSWLRNHIGRVDKELGKFLGDRV